MNNKKNIKLNRKEKIIAVAIIFVLIVSMFIGISGCRKKENNMSEQMNAVVEQKPKRKHKLEIQVFERCS